MTAHDLTVRKALAGAALLLGAAVLPGCTDWAAYDVDVAAGEVPFFATMRTSVIPDPYEMNRLPPEHSVALGSPYAIIPNISQANLDSVSPLLANPLPATPEVLAVGQEAYANYCAVCHGPEGAGNGTVVGAGKYPQPPSLLAGAALGRSEGYIYAISTVGRGLMPAYDRVQAEKRWAIAHYVKSLQGQAGAVAAPAAPAVQAPAAAPDAAAAPAPSTPEPAAGTPAGPGTR